MTKQFEKVNSWNDRKSRMFSQDQITEACDVLAAKDWLPSFWIAGDNVQIPLIFTGWSASREFHPQTSLVFEQLKEFARQNRVVTYTELGNHVGLHPRGTESPLRNIRDLCAARDCLS